MDAPFEIDLDSECVWYDDAWLNRDDLARKIRAMIDSGDFQVVRPSTALEYLTKSLGTARLLALRISPEMSDSLNQLAQQTGRPVGAVARDAINDYLASQAAARGQGVDGSSGMGASPFAPPSADDLSRASG
jgi:hypothetical protein